ncbi:hypothetical protein ACFOU2_16290 [Bacillus songklensis]|uniref:Uncharacterized protein n=1 Tax=Bacillus songklensis TaxID=1069116 RepID=A0ABV8B3Y2_9BACI
MTARLAFRLSDGKWLHIRRITHDTVELKICSDIVCEPAEFQCRIHEGEFVRIILDAIQKTFKNETS